MVQAVDTNLQGRLEQYKAVQDRMDRVPPDSEEALREDGLAWSCNVDWGGMEKGVAEIKDPLFNLATQPNPYVKLACPAEVPCPASALQTLAEKDAELLDEWGQFEYELEMMLDARAQTGHGIFHFPHPRSWVFRSLHPSNIIIPRDAKLNPETWNWFAIKTEFPITELIRRLEKPDAATTLGYRPQAIIEAIRRFAENGGEQWAAALEKGMGEYYINNLRTNDLAFAASQKNESLPGFILYVREWNGKISEKHLLSDGEFCAAHGFLFNKADRHECMDDMLCLFPHSLGGGFFHRVRGYGVKMLPFHDAQNRTFNRVFDVTWLSSGLMLQGGGDDLRRMSEVVVGPYTYIPDDLKIVQQSFANPGQGLVSMLREVERMSDRSETAFGGGGGSSSNPEKTAKEATMLYQDKNKMEGYAISRFYKQLGRFHAVRIKRMLMQSPTDVDPGAKISKAFQAEAGRLGIAKEIWSKIKADAARIFGDGNPVNQFLAMRDLMFLQAKFTASGQRSFTRHLVQSRLGSRAWADEFTGPEEKQLGADDLFMRERRMAQLENGNFETSDTKLDVAMQDHHLIHAGEHTIYAEEVAARLQQQHLSKADAFARLGRAQAHVSGHIQMLAIDPMAKAEFQDLQRRWAGIVNLMRQLGQQLQAEAGQAQQAAMEEQRNPRLSVREIEESETAKLRRQQMAEEHALKMKLAQETHDFELSRKGQSHTADLQSKLLQGATTL